MATLLYGHPSAVLLKVGWRFTPPQVVLPLWGGVIGAPGGPLLQGLSRREWCPSARQGSRRQPATAKRPNQMRWWVDGWILRGPVLPKAHLFAGGKDGGYMISLPVRGTL